MAETGHARNARIGYALLRGLLVRQNVARFGCGRGINRHISFVDVLNDSVLVDDKRGAISEALLFVKNPVVFDDCSFEIAEERKGDADVLREAAVGRNAVDTNTENLSIVAFEFGDISLIRLQFLRSTTGECQHIKGQHHILFSFEIAEFHFFAGGAGKCEIRRGVANFQSRLRRDRLLRVHHHAQRQ